MEKDFDFWGWLFGSIAGWISLCVVLIVVGALVTVVALRIDTTVVQPEVKQNKLHSADASISNANRYHTEIANIISTDNKIITQLNQAQAIEKAEPSSYSTDSRYTEIVAIQLPGIEQVRDQDVADYNADATNSNYSMDLPAGYPTKIDAQALPADTGKALEMLNKQVHDLQALSA
jgi:hypothetical protein